MLAYCYSDYARPLWLILTGAFTVPLTLLVAAPVLYVLRRRMSGLLCLLSGAVIGLLGSTPFLLGPGAPYNLRWVALLALCGLLSGAVFWLVAVYRNPLFERLRHVDSSA